MVLGSQNKLGILFYKERYSNLKYELSAEVFFV